MENKTTDHGTLENWSPQEVADGLRENRIVLIDVRTPQEYLFEHIDSALLAPMQYFDPSNMPGQTEKRIVFHCGSGVRSAKVAKRMLEAGTDVVAHMKGGFGAWKESKLPYIGTDVATGKPAEMVKGD